LSARRGVVKQAKRSAILGFILESGEDGGWRSWRSQGLKRIG
jgi:hypothetical protein